MRILKSLAVIYLKLLQNNFKICSSYGISILFKNFNYVSKNL